MGKTYIALIRREPDTDYWVDIPDLPGCVASGDTAEQAKANFQEVLYAHLQTMAEQGLPLPPPRTLHAVLSAETESFVGNYSIEIDHHFRKMR